MTADVMEIPLSDSGHVALVSAEDYARVLGGGPWYPREGTRTTYASRFKPSPSQMHRFITGWPLVDHMDGNGLNNTRPNLRPATPAQNNWNRCTNRNSRSGFKGVSRYSGRAPHWRAYITKDGERHALGRFYAPEDAARAYDRAAIELFGEFARTNFPREEYAS